MYINKYTLMTWQQVMLQNDSLPDTLNLVTAPAVTLTRPGSLEDW